MTAPRLPDVQTVALQPSARAFDGVRIGAACVRLVLAAAIVISVAATFAYSAERGAINPFNFFGFFTIQTNILMAAIWGWIGVSGLARVRLAAGADLLRGLVTTWIAIVGLVYAIFLAPLGAAGGVPVPWANVILHVIVPIAAVVDWILISDRRALRWRGLALVLSYPLVWLVVVLIRGATDGWVPYPFLDPSHGYGAVSLVVVLITVATLVVGAGVFALSRLRLVTTTQLGTDDSGPRNAST